MKWVKNNDWLSATPTQRIPWRLIARFATQFKAFYPAIALGGLIAFVSSLPLFAIVAIFSAIQKAVAVGDSRGLLTGVLAFLGVLAADAGARWTTKRLRVHIATRMDQRLVLDYYRALLNVSPRAFIAFQHRSNLYQRVVDAMAVTTPFTDVLIDSCQALIAMVVACAVLNVVSPAVALVLLVGAIGQCAWMAANAAVIRERRRATIAVNFPMVAKMLEVINNLLTIKALTAESTVIENIVDVSGRRQAALGRELATDANLTFVSQLIRMMTLALAIGISLWLFMRDALTSAETMAVYVIAGKVFEPVSEIARSYQRLLTISQNVKNYFEILDMPSEADARLPKSRSPFTVEGMMQPGYVATHISGVAGVPRGLFAASDIDVVSLTGTVTDRSIRHRLETVRPPDGDCIVMRRLCFRYAATESPVLKGLDLTVRRGERLSIIGKSGAGKTTLLRLILGFLEPTDGVLTVNGLTPHESSQHARFRRQFGVVSQSEVWFDVPLRENLTLGLATVPSDDELEEMLAAVGMRDELSGRGRRLDSIYTTEDLSLGQRQRLAIARALLRRPSIVLLDEPTSSLDFENEAVVLNAIERLMEGTTTITVAHRWSTIRRSPRVAVIGDGQLVAVGEHQQLIAGCEYYRNLVSYGAIFG